MSYGFGLASRESTLLWLDSWPLAEALQMMNVDDSSMSFAASKKFLPECTS